MSTPFFRPIDGRVLAGVCAAIANHYGWRVQNVRFGMLLLGLFTGIGVVLYVVLAIVIPGEWWRAQPRDEPVGMGFTRAIARGARKYADFGGRSARSTTT